jgi:pimeloyl-ACP methyl ester carboxylesterase
MGSPGSPASRPTIVWVSGSFSPASFYADVADGVRAKGYDFVVDTLPSSARAPPEKPATLSEDAIHFRNIVEDLCDQGKDVVLAMHSYGGVVGSECSQGLSKAERTALGKLGGIAHLIFVTCIVPDVGASLKDVTISGRSPWLIFREDASIVPHHGKTMKADRVRAIWSISLRRAHQHPSQVLTLRKSSLGCGR